MSRYRDQQLDCKVYVGDLDRDATEKDLERAFGYYGSLKSVWVAHNPPGFAFVEFDDSKDADDAVRGLDGTKICGSSVRVELSTGKVRPKPWMRDGGRDRMGGGGYRDRRSGGGYRDNRSGGYGGDRGGNRRGFNPNDKCYECGESGHYAYDCRNGGGSRGGSGGRSRRRSRSRSRSYERRRSYSRSRSRSVSRSRSRSRTPARN